MSPGQHAAPPEPPPATGSGGGRQRTWIVVLGVVVVAAIAVALVILVRESPGAQLGRAVDRTLDEGTARTEITGSIDDVPVLGSVELSVAEGDLDLAAQRAHLRRDVPILSELGLPALGEMGPVEVLFADGGAWLRAPFDTDRWVQVRAPGDPDEAAREAEVAPGLGNPLAVFTLLRAVEASPDDVAVDEITAEDDADGATRFSVLVDLDAVEEVIGEDSEGMVAAARRLAVDDQLPITVWVDPDGRIERLRLEGRLDLAGFAEVDAATTVTLHDFGADLAVERPAEDEVVSRDQLPDLDVDLGDLDPLGALREWLDQLPFP